MDRFFSFASSATNCQRGRTRRNCQLPGSSFVRQLPTTLHPPPKSDFSYHRGRLRPIYTIIIDVINEAAGSGHTLDPQHHLVGVHPAIRDLCLPPDRRAGAFHSLGLKRVCQKVFVHANRKLECGECCSRPDCSHRRVVQTRFGHGQTMKVYPDSLPCGDEIPMLKRKPCACSQNPLQPGIRTQPRGTSTLNGPCWISSNATTPLPLLWTRS